MSQTGKRMLDAKKNRMSAPDFNHVASVACPVKNGVFFFFQTWFVYLYYFTPLISSFL